MSLKQAAAGVTARIEAGQADARPLAGLMLAGFRAHWIFFAIAAVFLASINLALSGDDVAMKYDFTEFAVQFLLVTIPTLLLAIVTLRFLRLAIHERPKRPLLALLRDLKGFFCDHNRLANGVPMVLAMVVFIHCFSFVKSNIPFVIPFSWDETFMQWDKWLHFGHQPWELLQPLLGYPPVTFVINVSYNLWFMVMWTIWCWLAFSRRNTALRMQFFLAFMLSWGIGGSLLAMLLSSAGPCYYGLLGLTPNPYEAQMAYLYKAGEFFPLWALDIQEMLWAGYTAEPTQNIGISAMPSMHNAAALLFALVGWRSSRGLGIAMTLFAVLILIGSVHLAWHYAIDGYFGFVIALLSWWIAGWITRAYMRQGEVRRYCARLEQSPEQVRA